MKKIGKTIYLHRSNINAVSQEQLELIWDRLTQLASSEYEKAFNSYDIIKIDGTSVSFIESPDWDEAREPMVGNAYKVFEDGSVRVTKKKNNVQIYHHKWMFVADDYEGFDVAEAKKWSELWTSTLPATKEIKSRIGYRDNWIKILKEFGLEIR